MQTHEEPTPPRRAMRLVLCGVTRLAPAALVLAGLAGCGSEPPPPRTEEVAGRAEAGRDAPAAADEGIRIAPEVQERFGIATEAARPGPVEVTLDLPGEIVSDPDRVVHVKPPFAGTVQRVFEHVGDRVEAGDRLAELESARSLAPYTVKAGIAGVITSEHAAVGESVDVAHELFTIADTEVVWARLQVFPGDLARVQVGDPVEVLRPDATSGARGEISFVSPVLDHATRTANARVVLDNDGSYRPGLFVTGRVAVEREEAAVSVPSSALVREGRGWLVFVREGAERFAQRRVSVSRRGIERSAIRAGLEAGEEVVSDGAFLVKSAAARGEMGGGH